MLNILSCLNNDKICNNTYYKFYIANWFSQIAFIDFCPSLLFVVNLWLQLRNKCSYNMNVNWYFIYYLLSIDIYLLPSPYINKIKMKSKIKAKKMRYMKETSFIHQWVSDNFAELTNYFQIVKEYFLRFWGNHSYKHDTLLNLISNINIHHHFLKSRNEQNNKSIPNLHGYQYV